eukprot:CAMPEP_0114493556 /NCGR_PEP_ID=MMETSP0109-20121206/4171_1 /TAXON_ID=29199 /ORGANISM="Chlorarachnion reptans, Strain CCCM449" /LENGTH=554 /DNA_ID=CAMNT_0001670513 /DNA_START=61 /DNA_END=1725 /DNA_ORIENTATION=+
MYGSFSTDNETYDTGDEMILAQDDGDGRGNIKSPPTPGIVLNHYARSQGRATGSNHNGRSNRDITSSRHSRPSAMSLSNITLCAALAILLLIIASLMFGGEEAGLIGHHGPHPMPTFPNIVLPQFKDIDGATVSPPPQEKRHFVRLSDPRIGIHGRHLLSSTGQLRADWSATRIVVEFSNTRAVWADIRSANMSKAYSQNESYWCPHYKHLYQTMHAENGPSECPYWFDVWDVYVDGAHVSTLKLNTLNSQIEADPSLAIRTLFVFDKAHMDVALNATWDNTTHTLVLFKRTGPKKGGTLLSGLIFDKDAVVHQARNPYLKGRRIEILGASEENGECALGTKKDFYATMLESSVVGYGTLLGEYFQADYNYVAMGSEGIVLAAKPDSAPYLKYYTRTLYSWPNPAWNFSSFEADAVLVANGITDWGNVKDPSSLLPRFAQNFAQLLQSIRDHYPKAWIMLVPWKEQQIKGMTAGLAEYQQTRSGAKDMKIIMQVLNQSKWPANYRGCENHPSPLGHLDYATQLAPTLQNLLGWNTIIATGEKSSTTSFSYMRST